MQGADWIGICNNGKAGPKIQPVGDRGEKKLYITFAFLQTSSFLKSICADIVKTGSVKTTS